MIPSFVAEISSNHNRDLDRCLAFIDKAAEIGCAAVKFQLFRIRDLFAPEILARSEAHRNRRAWELPVEFIPTLAAHCRAKRVGFSCTPFYLQAVDELLPHVESLKIASYELLWKDLLKACAQTGKPIVLSTGMATLNEILNAVKVLRTSGCKDLTLLHCVSGYPTSSAEANLAAIETLRLTCGCPVGWSDHSVDPGVIYRAIHHWKASMVEFHLDLDGEGAEYGTGHCWLPHEIGLVIRNIRTGYEADGTGEKTIAPSELQDRQWRADPADGLRPFKEIRREYS